MCRDVRVVINKVITDLGEHNFRAARKGGFEVCWLKG